MDSSAKKQKYYSIMIVPHDARGRTISLKIPARWVWAAGGALLFSFLLVGSSIIYSTLISRRLVHYADTLSKNREQREVISSFSVKTDKVTRSIDELAQKDKELRKLLGIRGWQGRVRLSTEKVSAEAKSDRLSLQMDWAEARLQERRASFDEMKNWVNLVRSRLASTPSIWPIQGRIVSHMGYRSYPWRGYHAGIDIQAHRGALARATAGGVVSYVGWRHGYGKTVEIDHGFGVKTLYAHCSGYAVNTGWKVKKGQVVCYVGTTGWTTGPHLHYEVRRGEQPLNPTAFLNLDLLNASRLWGGKTWD
jgi:murein DD-endopeptidase MepM/ murein hydrolase activator NlpD